MESKNFDRKEYNDLDVNQNSAETTEDRGVGVSMLTRLALAVVVIASLVICITSLMRYNKLEEDRAELQAQIDAFDKDIAEKEYLIDAPVDDNYIVRIARDRFGLYFPNEVFHVND